MELESEFLTATNEKRAMILDQACRKVNVGKSIKKPWQHRFNHHNQSINQSTRAFNAPCTLQLREERKKNNSMY